MSILSSMPVNTPVVALLSISTPDFIKMLTDAYCTWNCEPGKNPGCNFLWHPVTKWQNHISHTVHTEKPHRSAVSTLNQIHKQKPEFPVWTHFHCYIILATVVVSNTHNTDWHLATWHVCLQFSMKNVVACLSLWSDELRYFSNCLE